MKRAWAVVCIALAATASAAVLACPAHALVPDGAHGWYWHMPQPVTGQLDIAFPSAGNVWSVGTDGLIAHSTDGGATWAAQESGTDADLWSASFPDGQNGWVCGGQSTGTQAGVVLATTDAGVTWLDKTPSGLTASLIDASFVSATHGWVGTGDGHVLKTTDAGTTWQTLSLPAYKGYVTVDFADASHGWAGGTKGRIWQTVDGGKTWRLSAFNGLGSQSFIMQLAFSDRHNGWALAEDQYGDSMVVTTNDGGAFWRPVDTGDQDTTGIFAASATDVWLVGTAYDVLDNEPVSFLHSTDGGFDWQSSTVQAAATPYVIAARGDAVCAVGDGALYSGDAGATWRSASSGQQYWFSGADAVSSSDVWAVDSMGALLHSSDGLRFVEQTPAVETGAPARGANWLMGVSFPSKDDGWVVGGTGDDSGVILHTTDAGQSWAPQTSTLSGELVAVDFLSDATTGWAVSDEADGGDGSVSSGAPLTMEHTTDGGATWIPQYVAADEVTAVDFVDATTGWAAGGVYDYNDFGGDATGVLFSSANGGFTWTRQKLPKGAPALTGLQFTDASDGWAVGTGFDDNGDVTEGWVLHTTNGGATWTRLTDLSDVLATTVHFVNATDGWLGGLNGVYATTDGGATWQRTAGGDGVEAIAATDTDHVWAFGDGFMASTLDTNENTAAPVTLIADAGGWQNKPFSVALSPEAFGAAGVQSTTFSYDGGATKTGTNVDVPAAADHHNDGYHTITYSSTDTAGNGEQTEVVGVGVDTLGPACFAPRKSVIDTGHVGALYFQADDALSGVAQATVSVVGAHGQVVRRFVERSNEYGYYSDGYGFPYNWLSFRCTLKPGTYRVEVRATDYAGNQQALVGRNVLRVVRSGAPAFHRPGWPAGLWGGSGYAPVSGGAGHRLGFVTSVGRTYRPAWLLRLYGHQTLGRTSPLLGIWKLRHWPGSRTVR